MHGDGVGGEQGLHGVGGLGVEQGEAGDFASGGAVVFGLAAARGDAVHDGLDEMLDDGGIEFWGGGLGHDAAVLRSEGRFF